MRVSEVAPDSHRTESDERRRLLHLVHLLPRIGFSNAGLERSLAKTCGGAPSEAPKFDGCRVDFGAPASTSVVSDHLNGILTT